MSSLILHAVTWQQVQKALHFKIHSVFIKLLFQYLPEYELEEELAGGGKMENKDTSEDVGDQSDSSM